MPDRLIARLSQWATRRNVLLLLAVYLLIVAVILPAAQTRIEAASGGVGPLDLVPYYGADQAYSMIEAYGPEGRPFYLLIELTVDIIYPVIYSLFFSLTILYFLNRQAAGRPGLLRLALLPFAGLICDFVENAGIVTMLLAYPAQLSLVGTLTGIVTTLKWIFAVLSILSLLYALGTAVMARLNPPRPAQP